MSLHVSNCFGIKALDDMEPLKNAYDLVLIRRIVFEVTLKNEIIVVKVCGRGIYKLHVIA